MISFTLLKRATPGKEKAVDLSAPALPRVGDHVSHDKSGISGYVSDVMFWWDETGELRNIQVAVK